MCSSTIIRGWPFITLNSHLVSGPLWSLCKSLSKAWPGLDCAKPSACQCILSGRGFPTRRCAVRSWCTRPCLCGTVRAAFRRPFHGTRNILRRIPWSNTCRLILYLRYGSHVGKGLKKKKKFTGPKRTRDLISW